MDRSLALQKQLAEYYRYWYYLQKQITARLHFVNPLLMNRINPDEISYVKLENIAKGYQFRGVVSGEEEDCLIGRYTIKIRQNIFFITSIYLFKHF